MTIQAHAKVNIFLKIVGTREQYHLLSSRFVRLENLYDTLSFTPVQTTGNGFRLEGEFGCKREQNTIYKAYRLLLKTSDKSSLIEDFFNQHAVHVKKRIPEFAGLGGGSSDAAAFLRLCNQVCKLGFDTAQLAEIGKQIGADVPFFVYDYPSANVSGIGEVVAPFEEEIPDIVTFTPDVRCDTGAVYRYFRAHAADQIPKNQKLAQQLCNMPGKTVLEHFDAATLNDLFPPALALYPALMPYAKEGWFFSGSGSTFFKTGA